MLTSKIFNSIHDIDPIVWDASVDNIHFYHQHVFLTCLEDGKVEHAQFWYLMLYDQEKLVCTAVLSAFVINLDLMIGSHWLSKAVKWTGTGLFKVKILFCGTPVSIGHKNVYAIKGYEENSIETIAALMEKIAKEQKINHLVFKEFMDPEAHNLGDIFNQNGYFIGNSLPYISLPVQWKNYAEYMQHIRSGYRRQIIKSAKKLNDKTTIKILLANQFDAAIFYQWYSMVMDRASVKLEVLNEPFFHLFFERMQNKAKIFVFEKSEIPISGFLTVEVDKTLYFVWAGKPHDRNDENDDYFNLLNAVIRYSIDNQFKTIHLGQTAYYTKQRFGGEIHLVFLYYKARKTLTHSILKRFSNQLFPKIELQKLSVLKG